MTRRLSHVGHYATTVERVPMPQRKAPMRRTEIRPASMPLSSPRSTVPQVSKRRKALNHELAKVVAEKRRTVRFCQAQPMIRAALAHPDNTEADTERYVLALQACRSSQPTDGHHLLKRTRGSAATLIDPSNIILTCSPCNTGFIESWPDLAARAGLLVPSSAVKRILGRIAR